MAAIDRINARGKATVWKDSAGTTSSMRDWTMRQGAENTELHDEPGRVHLRLQRSATANGLVTHMAVKCIFTWAI